MLTVSTLLARNFLEVEGLDFLKAVLDQQMPLSVWQPGEDNPKGNLETESMISTRCSLQ